MVIYEKKYIYFERGKEGKCAQANGKRSGAGGGERERERERENPKRAPCCQLKSQCRARAHEL